MTNVDESNHPGWSVWRHKKLVTLGEAGSLLSGFHPSDFAGKGHFDLPAEVIAMCSLVSDSIIDGTLVVHQIYVTRNGEQLEVDRAQLLGREQLNYETELTCALLAEWCDKRGIPHPWSRGLTSAALDLVSSQLPKELRIAIEAFHAVRNDSGATAGKSPRAALLAWLKQHKSDVGQTARDRIATMANWQKEGGAPPTPNGTEAQTRQGR